VIGWASGSGAAGRSSRTAALAVRPISHALVSRVGGASDSAAARSTMVGGRPAGAVLVHGAGTAAGLARSSSRRSELFDDR
jgi:hypothetical protein